MGLISNRWTFLQANSRKDRSDKKEKIFVFFLLTSATWHHNWPLKTSKTSRKHNRSKYIKVISFLCSLHYMTHAVITICIPQYIHFPAYVGLFFWADPAYVGDLVQSITIHLFSTWQYDPMIWVHNTNSPWPLFFFAIVPRHIFIKKE